MVMEGLKEEEAIAGLRDILEISDPFSKGGIYVRIADVTFLFPHIKAVMLRDSTPEPNIILRLTVKIIQQSTSSAN